MQNITKNLIIAMVVLLVVVVVIVLFGRRTTETGEPTFWGKLFPESATTPPRPSQGGEVPLPFWGGGKGIEGAKEAGFITPTEAKDLPAGTLIRLSSDAVSSITVSASP